MLNEFDQENQLRQEREKGLQQGLQQGEDTKARAIARKMISDSLDVEIVAKYTGLSSEEIASLYSVD